MVKRLIKHGNSYAMIIDKPILELLHIGPDTELEVTTNGDSILVSPVRDPARQEKFDRAVERLNERFADDLRRLGE